MLTKLTLTEIFTALCHSYALKFQMCVCDKLETQRKAVGFLLSQQRLCLFTFMKLYAAVHNSIYKDILMCTCLMPFKMWGFNQ